MYDNDQVINEILLIGDAPANTRQEVERKRRKSLINFVYTKFFKTAYWNDEVQKLLVKVFVLTHFIYMNLLKIILNKLHQ